MIVTRYLHLRQRVSEAYKRLTDPNYVDEAEGDFSEEEMFSMFNEMFGGDHTFIKFLCAQLALSCCASSRDDGDDVGAVRTRAEGQEGQKGQGDPASAPRVPQGAPRAPRLLFENLK